jgi:hypothetical protein
LKDLNLPREKGTEVFEDNDFLLLCGTTESKMMTLSDHRSLIVALETPLLLRSPVLPAP